MMAGILTRDSALLIPTWLGTSSQALVLKIVALVINRYYYGFRIIMSINKTTHSPLALREGFHVVLLSALAERLQGRDWVLKGGTNLRLYFGSIRFSEDIDLDVGKDDGGAMQDDPPLLLPSYTRPAAIRQKINALASRTHVQARDVFDLFVLGDGTLRGIDTGLLRRWLDDATLRNARSRALEISHAEYSDTVLAYLDPAQREQLQDEDTWIARQLLVGDLIDQILAVPPETIT